MKPGGGGALEEKPPNRWAIGGFRKRGAPPPPRIDFTSPDPLGYVACVLFVPGVVFEENPDREQPATF
ncbi:hypothetical protein Pan54_41490 [Rubinisphaera italica]|uniref:Uncharacterized protein n=1 Tax=Rubinisphaera italica TaxID=2527969 RepID=A0A5C5XJK7_9PLAN|nr:hypothetical protein Pan54_41490 [Rubinisphaera italica]